MLQIRYIWGKDKLQIKDSETNGLSRRKKTWVWKNKLYQPWVALEGFLKFWTEKIENVELQIDDGSFFVEKLMPNLKITWL